MARGWNRLETWLALGAVGTGVLIAGIGGLFAFMTMTAKQLHPDAQSVPSAASAGVEQSWAAAIDDARQIVREGLVEQNLPGLSVAVGVDDGIVWAEGFGFSDLELGTDVTPNTRFRIGSASTVLTSAAAGLLLEQGKLKLDDEIQTVVPAFPKKEWPVTLRHVMGHTAGLRSDGGDESVLFSRDCDGPADALDDFADRSLLFEPGTSYRYSNYGWIVISAAIEAASDEPFGRFMRRHVFEPLGMERTRAESATEPIPERATFYFPRFAANPRYGLHDMRPIHLSCYAGAGVFLSTPSDLVRFGLAINGGKLLQPATVKTLQSPGRLASGAETGYGLGWDLESVTVAGRSTTVVGHDGTLLGGPVASLMIFPEHGLVVALTSNISYADTVTLGTKIAEAFVARRKDRSGE